MERDSEKEGERVSHVGDRVVDPSLVAEDTVCISAGECAST